MRIGLAARRVPQVQSKARNADYEILRYRGKGCNGWIWAGIGWSSSRAVGLNRDVSR
jgi:hypothetical protein